MPTIVRAPRVFEKSPLWPLPPDYESLASEEVRRLARLNAACLTGPKYGVYGWHYFVKHYLLADPESRFDPEFYVPPFRDWGAVHLQLVRSWETDLLSAWACPRGSGKSTTLQSYILWKLLTNRQYEINLVKMKDDLVIGDFARLRHQLERNPRILADFGQQRSERGDGVWTHHELHTTQQCRLRGLGVLGGKRGFRAAFNACDDIEQDPKEATPTDERREEIKTMVLQVLLPMLNDEDCHMTIVGTNLHQRSFLFHVVDRDANEADRDPRFRDELWFKALVDAEGEGDRNAWASKFTPTYLALQRERLGEELYNREFMNRPGSSDKKPLVLRPSMHGYWVEGDLNQENPWLSNAQVVWNDIGGSLTNPVSTRRSMSYVDWITSLYRCIIVDYAYSTSADSDNSIIHVLGVDAANNWFSLDMTRGIDELKRKLDFPSFCKMIWKWAERWRVTHVGAEAFPIQEQWVDMISAEGDQMRELYGYAPPLVPIKPNMQMEKGSRILRLQGRFERGKIKFPEDRRNSPPYSYLYHQIAYFTEDLGNLKKDDEIDTLSLMHDMVKGGRPAGTQNNAGPVQTNVEALLAGEKNIEGTDIPLILAINVRSLDDGTLAKLQSIAREQRYAEATESAWNRPDDDGGPDWFAPLGGPPHVQ